MKTSAIQKFRRKLAADVPVFGVWVTLEAPTVTEIAVALGLDWIVIDAEHGHLDWKEIVEHLRATVRSDTVALVRIEELNAALIKRALDLGADGIVIPWVETPEQLRQAVACARYPLEGVRGIGAERATAWGQAFVEHTAQANEHVLVVPILESVRAEANVAQLCRIDGVELMFFGPADFSASAGHRGHWEGPGVAERLLAMKNVIRAAGKHCGVVTTSHENLTQRVEQGFRMLGLGLDTGLLLRGLKAALATVGLDRPMQTSLEPLPSPAPILNRPPESMRPDRGEVMTSPVRVEAVEIAPGVRFQCLVGAFNEARDLTTGLVTLAPGAALPYHMHSFTESITLLEGDVHVAVEGRGYELALKDNLVVRPGLAHQTGNPSKTRNAVIHIAMATANPTRTLVNEDFKRRAMPADSTGMRGRERVNRFATAPRSAAGPSTEFIDGFNDGLVPGLEMSGGYGLFHPGGRLPAHVHDFDESICILSGEATCVVEGRRYVLQERTTALVPRGRVHYFINESGGPMEMLWVYAGPLPERILVEESCATAEGNPWR